MANQIIQLSDGSTNLFPTGCYRQIFSESMTSTDTNWFKSSGTFTVSKPTLVCLEVPWVGVGVLGCGIAFSNSTMYQNCHMIYENTNSQTFRVLMVISSGTHCVWTKYAAANKTNPVKVYEIMELIS